MRKILTRKEYISGLNEKHYTKYKLRDISRRDGSDDPSLYIRIGGLSGKDVIQQKDKHIYHHIAHIYVHDAQHLKFIKEALSDEVYKTSKSNIYITSYDNIEQIRSAYNSRLLLNKFNNEYKDIKKQKADLKAALK